jgi:hypothetical protein
MTAMWSQARRIAFRFLWSYLVLYALPFPFERLVLPLYSRLWYAVVPWVGQRFLHLDGIALPRERLNSDATFGYVQLLCLVVLAAIATVVWTLLDSKRPDYNKLHYWLRVYIRFFLAHALLFYAMVKIVDSQFPFPALWRLAQPYGESSPMGLLWTFMGYSRSYTFFSGALEATAALLLCFRRTVTAGALLAMAVIANIVMLNFSYDIQVKMFSLNLLLMAVVLVYPDWRRLANLLVMDRMDQSRWMRMASVAAKAVFIVAAVGAPAWRAMNEEDRRLAMRADAPIYGIYEVDEFVRNGQVAPPLTTDPTRWRTAIFDPAAPLTVRFMNDSTQKFPMGADAGAKVLSIVSGGKEDRLSWREPDGDHLVLEGQLMGDQVAIKLHKVDEAKFLLVRRGFHWINEFPFDQ